jgi:hypothetical protein
MKNFFVLSALILLLSPSAKAVDRTVSADYDPAQREIQLLIEDAQESTRACDYYVQQLMYSPMYRMLTVRLAEEPCFTDVVAKKKAILKWNLPRSLHMKDFCLRVDSKRLARIKLDASSVSVLQDCK